MSEPDSCTVARKGAMTISRPSSTLVVLINSAGPASVGLQCSRNGLANGFFPPRSHFAQLSSMLSSSARPRLICVRPVKPGMLETRLTGTMCWARSANSARATIGARKSPSSSRSIRFSRGPGVGSAARSSLQGFHGAFVASFLARAANMAAPRLPPDTPLTAKMCWEKLGHWSWMRARILAVNCAA